MRAETKFIWGYAECRHHSAKPNGNQMRAETKFIWAMPKCCANESKRSSLILPSAANIQLVSAETIRQSQMGIK